MSEDVLIEAAQEFDLAAEELELAVRHLRTAAGHFSKHEVPRGCAHAFAAQGHILDAQAHIDHRARVHAAYSIPGE